MVKYAYDTHLVAPEVNSCCEDELKYITSTNGRQIIICASIHPNGQNCVLCPRCYCAKDEQASPIPRIQCVNSIKVLGVTVSNLLSVAGHVSALLDTCARTLYGLRVFRAHSLHQDCLDEVFHCTVLAKLLYASPAWSGFCSAADIGKLDRFLNRCRKPYRCRQLNKDISELYSLADHSLLLFVLTNSQHVLHHFLPAKSTQP